jgi:Fe-Mn family superoxide dismutase
MELHHKKHHQTYVTNYVDAGLSRLTLQNVALEKYEAALESKNIKAQIGLQPAIRFNGGGHINHSVSSPVSMAHVVILGESYSA